MTSCPATWRSQRRLRDGTTEPPAWTVMSHTRDHSANLYAIVIQDIESEAILLDSHPVRGALVTPWWKAFSWPTTTNCRRSERFLAVRQIFSQLSKPHQRLQPVAHTTPNSRNRWVGRLWVRNIQMLGSTVQSSRRLTLDISTLCSPEKADELGREFVSLRCGNGWTEALQLRI